MLSLLLAPLVALAPEWSLLAFPRSARDSAAPPSESLLADAAHLDVYGSFRAPGAEPTEPAISSALFQQMLEETLRQRGLKLELRPQAGLLLARGDAPALEVARALTADLDRQTAAFEIDLEITLRTAAGETLWRRRVPAGTDVYFGSRAARPFIAGFEVQVAQDAGQAEPRLGSALFGTGLHLRAARLAGGARVFVDGVFDSASIASVEAFDPETPDMGVFEQPRIDSVQVAFAGAMASGGVLEVRLVDAGPLRGESVLSVRATARADATPANDGWALIDLSFSSFAPRALESVDAGLGLASPALDFEQQGALLTPPTLASILESDRSTSDGRTGRALLFWSRSMLAIPRSDPARIEAARARPCRRGFRRGDPRRHAHERTAARVAPRRGEPSGAPRRRDRNRLPDRLRPRSRSPDLDAFAPRRPRVRRHRGAHSPARRRRCARRLAQHDTGGRDRIA